MVEDVRIELLYCVPSAGCKPLHFVLYVWRKAEYSKPIPSAWNLPFSRRSWHACPIYFPEMYILYNVCWCRKSDLNRYDCSVHFECTVSAIPPFRLTKLCGGESEIRTQGWLPIGSLVDCWFKPLTQLSVVVIGLVFGSKPLNNQNDHI